MRNMFFFMLSMAFGAVAPDALAHGGGLDANGCHTNKKTGDHHCHAKKAPGARPQTPEDAPKPSETTTPEKPQAPDVAPLSSPSPQPD